MPENLKSWLFDPTVGKLITVMVGLLVVVALVHLLQRSVNRYIQ